MHEPTITRKTPTVQLVIFRFLCPLCGAKPEPCPLRKYLHEWAGASIARVQGLVSGLESALRHYGPGQPRWVALPFARSVEKAIESAVQTRRVLGALPVESPPEATSDTGCAVCGLTSCRREPDRYFTDWAKACRVQTANLLYETGLILWAIVREIPIWCDAEVLASLDRLRRALRSASKGMAVLECPICHRPTTHLYSTDRRFCRWCLDMSGGFGVGMTIKSDGTLELIEPDPTSAIVEDSDLLPPTD